MEKIIEADKYGTKAIQAYILPILVDLDKLCRENGIKYSLAGGCLLGAVRHRGFVPWDDDADIVFDRENYEKFIALIKEQLPEKYVITGSIWVKRITRKDNPRMEEEEGCVDLFVLDNVPDRKLEEKLKNFCLKTLQGMLKRDIQYNKFSFKERVLVFATHMLGKPFNQEWKLNMYDKVSQWGNGCQTKKINNYVTYFSMISTIKYDSDLTENYMDAEFEGHKLMIFQKYDHALTVQFGDYMTPVPIEQRVQKHLKRP